MAFGRWWKCSNIVHMRERISGCITIAKLLDICGAELYLKVLLPGKLLALQFGPSIRNECEWIFETDEPLAPLKRYFCAEHTFQKTYIIQPKKGNSAALRWCEAAGNG